MKCYLLNLSQDCDCTTHDGPHWLHMDKLMFEKNLQILKRKPSASLESVKFSAFTMQESIRMKNKLRELEKLVQREDVEFVLPVGYNEGDYGKRIREVLSHQQVEKIS